MLLFGPAPGPTREICARAAHSRCAAQFMNCRGSTRDCPLLQDAPSPRRFSDRHLTIEGFAPLGPDAGRPASTALFERLEPQIPFGFLDPRFQFAEPLERLFVVQFDVRQLFGPALLGQATQARANVERAQRKLVELLRRIGF